MVENLPVSLSFCVAVERSHIDSACSLHDERRDQVGRDGLSRSRGSEPIGVSYESHGERAHPSK
jgi:hypothetical protein